MEEQVEEITITPVIPTGTALINIEPKTDLALTPLLAEIERFKVWADKLVIADDAGLRSATEDISSLRKLSKAIEEKRKEYVEPLNSYVKDINAYFKQATVPLSSADAVISRKMLEYKAECDRKRKEAEEINRMREEAQRREAALNDGEIKESVVTIPVPAQAAKTTHTDVGSASTRDNWKVEVTDFAALPDEYKIPDAVKLGKIVRAGLHTIPGCRIWNDPSLSVRT